MERLRKFWIIKDLCARLQRLGSEMRVLERNQTIEGYGMRRYAFFVFLIVALMSGCGSDSAPKVTDRNLLYDLSAQNVPFPNDLFYLPAPNEPADGSLNIPYEANSSQALILKEVDKLDGFSTTSPIFIGTNTLINPTSLIGKIHIYETRATYGGAMPMVEEVVGEFRDFRFVSQKNRIVILPLKPFKSHTTYVVAIDRGAYDLDGTPITPDRTLRYLMGEGSGNEKLDLLKPFYQKMLRATNRSIDNTVAIWSFTTQTIGERVKKLMAKDYESVRLELKALGYSSKELLAFSGVDSSQMVGNDRLYGGVLRNLPYFLAKPSPKDPIAPVQKGMDLQRDQKVDIPVLVSVPKECTMPSTGWPVVIFMHGITQNRTNLLAVAESFAKICYASVAIDLPLHGIVNENNPLYMAGYERTFDLDLIDNDSKELGGDGRIDPSGTWYINLQNPAISRGNMLQSTADIMGLIASFNKVVSKDGVKFDSDRIYFVGHSLGAMVPFGYLANADFRASVLANPGGGIARLLDSSERFGPVIHEALKKAGVEPGSEAYERYMLMTQTLIDDADPVNYASKVANKSVLAFEVKDDRVIPNRVLSAPLSGTDPLLKEMKALNVLEASLPLTSRVYASRFLYGDHSSLLVPVYPEITEQMHLQMVSYLGSDGKRIELGDRSLLGVDADF
jgi:dienelactone hydrolase